jgi:hypoxanthine phosphoribosyltransferase
VFARARVRHTVLPVLEGELGPGIAEALARTAQLLRADADALDAEAAAAYARITAAGGTAGGAPAADGLAPVALDVAELAALSPAVRTRTLRRAALAAGASASALRAEHVWAVEELVTRWRGQKPVPLPSGVQARRHDGRITLVASPGPMGDGVPAGAPRIRSDASDAGVPADRERSAGELSDLRGS